MQPQRRDSALVQFNVSIASCLKAAVSNTACRVRLPSRFGVLVNRNDDLVTPHGGTVDWPLLKKSLMRHLGHCAPNVPFGPKC